MEIVMLRISAIVMASGMSKRMNRDKLHMKINGKCIYEYILETIKDCDFHETVVVAKDDDILRKARSLGYLAERNTRNFLGQSESIKIALKNISPADGYMFFVADQPFIKVETVKKLCIMFSKNSNRIVVPYYNGIKGSPVIFPYSLKSQLMSLENDQGGTTIINSNKHMVLSVNIQTECENLDIDTMEDYNKAINIFDRE